MKKRLISIPVLIILFIFCSFCTQAADSAAVIKCCVGEKITIKHAAKEKTQYDSSFLKENKDGSFSAVKDGNTSVTFTKTSGTGKNKKTTKRNVKVKISKAVKHITVKKSEVFLGQGETFRISYKTNDKTFCNSVSFTSSDKKLAKVGSDGVITAGKKSGTAKIKVKTSNGVETSVKVNIKAAPEKVSFSKTKYEFGKGENAKLKLVFGNDAASFHKTFKSSDSKILKVDSFGNIKAVKNGTVKITVKTYNGKKASCKVTVKSAPKKITLSKTAVTLGKGEKFRLRYSVDDKSAASSFKITSSDKKVATVSPKGEIIAKSVGTAKITVKAYNGVYAKCKVTVKYAPKAVFASESEYTVEIGHNLNPKLTFSGNAYSNAIRYTSSDPSVAKERNGRIHAIKIGSAKITAETYNGKKVSFWVNVIAMKVPFVSQVPDYPTGCEGASCTALLKYHGYNITLDEMISIIPREDIVYKDGRRYGPRIEDKFVGNPRSYYDSASPGYGAFSPCIKKSLQKAIDKKGGKHKAVKITGENWQTFLDTISEGHPIVIWATYKMLIPQNVNSWYARQPDGSYEYFEYPKGTHVFVLTGYSDTTVTVMDPYNGTLVYNAETFVSRWKLLGQQGVYIK